MRVGLRVDEMLQLEALKELRLIAGHGGVCREIEEVSVLEVPKGFDPYLHGGELILTSLHSTHQDLKAQLEVIERLSAARAAALCIHPIITGTTIRAELAEAAEAANLPLVLLPQAMSYATVISAVLGTILNRQNMVMKKSENINQELTRLVLRGGDVSTIASTLARLIRQPVLITDDGLEPIAMGTASSRHREFLDKCLQAPAFCQTLKLIRAGTMGGNSAADGEMVTFKVEVGGQVFNQVVVQASVAQDSYGYIFTWEMGQPMQELDYIAMSHASTALALKMVQRKAIHEAEYRLRNDFMTEVFAGQFVKEEELYRRARRLGLHLEKKHLVLLVRVEQEGSPHGKGQPDGQSDLQKLEQRLHSSIHSILSRESPNSLVLPRGDTALVFMHFDRLPDRSVATEKAKTLAGEIHAALGRVFHGAAVSGGIGDLYPSPLNLGKSHREALQALEVGEQIFGPGRITSIQDLGVYGVLAQTSRAWLGNFTTGLLDRLLAYDAQNRGELVRTLEVYLDEKESLARVAKRLFIHPNTVKYRIDKVREVLGFDPFARPEQRLHFHLALKARRLLDQ